MRYGEGKPDVCACLWDEETERQTQAEGVHACVGVVEVAVGFLGGVCTPGSSRCFSFLLSLLGERGQGGGGGRRSFFFFYTRHICTDSRLG